MFLPELCIKRPVLAIMPSVSDQSAVVGAKFPQGSSSKAAAMNICEPWLIR
jgi:hypothetical protein